MILRKTSKDVFLPWFATYIKKKQQKVKDKCFLKQEKSIAVESSHVTGTTFASWEYSCKYHNKLRKEKHVRGIHISKWIMRRGWLNTAMEICGNWSFHYATVCLIKRASNLRKMNWCILQILIRVKNKLVWQFVRNKVLLM